MSVTLGVSLTISGRVVAARTAAVTSPARRASTPNIRPAAPTLGQEMLSSIPAMLGARLEAADDGDVVLDAVADDVDDHRHVPGAPAGA